MKKTAVKKKIQKRRDDAEEARAEALQEALEADKRKEEEAMEPLHVKLPDAESAERVDEPEVAESKIEPEVETAEEPVRELVQPIHRDTEVGFEEPNIVIEEVFEESTQVSTKLEIEYREEIEQLKLLIEAKDAEILRLTALVEV